MSTLRRVRATRYVVPLREGGSLPGIVEGDDLGTYVCKFRGAGQGPRVLVAEVVVGELARALGIATPELVTVELEGAIARYEADEEVQDLLTASLGLNLGIDFLPGAFGYDVGDRSPTPSRRPASCGSTPSPPTSTARGATRTCWSGTGGCGPSTTGRRCTSTTRGPGGPGSPERFAAQPYRLDDHVLVGHLAGLPAARRGAGAAGHRGAAARRRRPRPRGVAGPGPGRRRRGRASGVRRASCSRGSHGGRAWLGGGAS